MTDNNPLTGEQAAVWRLLSLTSSGVTTELTRFSGWLMTGLGAALTFLVANLDSAKALADLAFLRCSLILFVISMLIGLFAHWLSAAVKAGLATSNESLQLMRERLDPEIFAEAFASGLIWPYRRLFLWRVSSPRSSDALSGIRFTAKLSQYQALLILFQFLFATAAVLLLAIGIKV